MVAKFVVIPFELKSIKEYKRKLKIQLETGLAYPFPSCSDKLNDQVLKYLNLRPIRV